ncbi:MAG: tRNA preQ1(34) S-adenosylmethionine ribosyltransferase-isomerase QueA [Planctomycetaceae bacterium]|nr:tRNA preQ1(34) S-adenosylmethionine ribosyltransferase-isomerase QueA [Planctomycetaceae bacterium]
MSELDHYDYHLPRELIAQHPLPCRSDARLLVVRRDEQSIDHGYVRDLPAILNPGDCLVFNDTKVIPARLVGRRERTGARWSGLFLAADEHGVWQVLSKTRGKLEPGEAINVISWDTRHSLVLRLVAKLDDGAWAVLPEPEGQPHELLAQVGRVPLPPYIRDGEMVEEDVDRYQTVFASEPGAVAAPTAGLHFTPELLAQLKKRGVLEDFVTLHVGIGTFRPITVERLADHPMHSEWCSVGKKLALRLRSAKAKGGRIVAVGTTVARSLESAAEGGELAEYSGDTTLFIRPPYQFRAVDALLTNFHLPKSTLLILVRTFGGDSLIARAYEQAIRERYRFYSYGDAMLIL